MKPEIGQIVIVYKLRCRITAVYPAGTIDAEEIDGPHAYRITGLNFL
jgi:hypothetical protein